jgi:hypothetical protein
MAERAISATSGHVDGLDQCAHPVPAGEIGEAFPAGARRPIDDRRATTLTKLAPRRAGG